MSKWMIANKKADFERISRKFGIRDITARLIANRLISRRETEREECSDEAIERYLSAGTEALHDPRGMADIEKGARIMLEKIKKTKKIRVIGDYDVDGITGTALGVRGLKYLGARKTSYFVPSRYEGGYGISRDTIDKALEDHVDLLLTVDNGVSCYDEVEYAIEKGLPVVITDHHETPELLPRALAVVDPKRPDERSQPNLAHFLDLVALGTVGDVMQLDANNRKLVKYGFERIRTGKSVVGIKSLAASCRLDLAAVNSISLAFEICPRLNAPGRIRLENNPAVDLMLTDDETQASILARDLEMCNRRRGDYERVFIREAMEDAQKQSGNSAIVLYRPNWLVGLGGLIASRIKEQFSVPCFVFSGEGTELSGSARSVSGFSLVKNLQLLSEQYPDLLLRFGGHAMAAGASIRVENFDKFKTAFNLIASRNIDNAADGEIMSDGELPSGYLNLAFARDLEFYGPWGNGFEEPCFDGEYTVEDVFLIANRHLRFSLRNDDGSVLRGIKLRATPDEREITKYCRVRAVYTVGVNHYMGTERLEIRISAIEMI